MRQLNQKDSNCLLRYAAVYDCLQAVTVAVQIGADIDTRLCVTSEKLACLRGGTPLFLAIYNKNCDMVELLLNKGASQYVKTYGDLTVYSFLETMTPEDENSQEFRMYVKIQTLLKNALKECK